MLPNDPGGHIAAVVISTLSEVMTSLSDVMSTASDDISEVVSVCSEVVIMPRVHPPSAITTHVCKI